MKIIIFILILLIIIPTSSAWANRSWNYSVNNTITDGLRPYTFSIKLFNNSGNNTATEIYCNDRCNSDFSDVDFYLNDTIHLNSNYLGKFITSNSSSGGTIFYDGGYVYHKFTSNGTFIPNANLSVQVLVVAGGGGGAAGNGGGAGGGAGGLVYAAEHQVTSGTSYNIVVGSGGVGVAGSGSSSGNGTNSTFDNIIALGGGGGTTGNGSSGGSGDMQ